MCSIYLKSGIGLFRILLFGGLVISGYGLAVADGVNAASVQTAFMFNFFKYIDWPASGNHQDVFTLCTTEGDQLGNSLSVLENKTLSGKFLVIRRGLGGKDLKDCHMVFISSTANAAIIIQELKELPIVTVSEQANFIDQGGILGFVQNDNHIGFEINLGAANAEGLHISAQLLKLAKRVNTEK
ncbi:YfiR family protein [Methylomonas sp. AM2-LC]|uniref:YfiR family protein n=1 Tax=Methylomonas sp. AM2-LC TaxID=3153301 RepID=UPI003264C1B4